MRKPAHDGAGRANDKARIARSDEATVTQLIELCRVHNVRLTYNTNWCAACEQPFDADRRVASFAIASFDNIEPTAYMICRACQAVLNIEPQIITGMVESNIRRGLRNLAPGVVMKA